MKRTNLIEKNRIRERVGSLLALPQAARAAVRAVGRYRVRAFAWDPETDAVGDPLWEDIALAPNLVLEPARNDMLDKYFEGSGYTAAWYCGLVNASGYSAISVDDTPAAHAGWSEYTGYTQANRPSVAWAAAANGAKAFASEVSFTIPSSVTLKGPALFNSATKGGTTGIMYSAGLFTEGDRVITGSALLLVSYETELLIP
jgi:hypothetical protein